MRITIDTDLQCIIVPNSYYTQIDKLNDIIEAADGKPLDYTQYIRDCFSKAIDSRIIQASEVAAHKASRTNDAPATRKESDTL